jgi:hypothetical protein
MAVSADSLEVLVAFGADNGATASGLEILVAFGADNGVTASGLEVLTAVQEDVVEPPGAAVEQPKFVVVNT